MLTRVPAGVKLFDPSDFKTRRELIFESAINSLRKSYPRSYGGVRVELGDDLQYVDPDDYSLADQKKALLNNDFLARRLRGTVKLFDDKTNELLDQRTMTLMRVPWLTQRGTFIHGGNDYVTTTQARLVPGVYGRWTDAGNAEIHINSRPGSGPSLRVQLEPESGQFKLHAGPQSSVHLYSVLKDIGVSDDEMKEAWGEDTLRLNSDNYNPQAIDQAYKQMVPKFAQDMTAPREMRVAQVQDALNRTEVLRGVAERNMPGWKPQPVTKAANVSTDEMRLIANFLNKNHQAGIPLDGTLEEMEQAVIAFLTDNPSAMAYLAAADY